MWCGMDWKDWGYDGATNLKEAVEHIKMLERHQKRGWWTSRAGLVISLLAMAFQGYGTFR